MTEIEDSDEDDYEGYFLKPASSAYNIQERIKQANQELFDELEEEKRKKQEQENPENINGGNGKKVTFCAVLEHYEPEGLDSMQSASSIESISTINESENKEPEIGLNKSELNDTTSKPDLETDDLINCLRLSPTSEEEEVIEEEEEKINEEIDNEKPIKPVEIKEAQITHKNVPLKEEQKPEPKREIPNRKSKLEKKTSNIQCEIPFPNNNNNKISFRYCCEYKKHDPQFKIITKYNGHLTETQLENKRKSSEKLKIERREKEFKKFQDNFVRYQANEEAFANWLRRKMKNSTNKSKNMYDETKKKSKHKKK